MIPQVEIREKAVAEGVPETTIIKDYALSWLLKSINDLSNSFILKGGTGIRKAFIEGYRFSLDLDFTLTRSIEFEMVLRESSQLAKRESGIDFSDDVEIKDVKSGFEAKIPFRLYYPIQMKIKIDITTPENEIIVLPIKSRRLIHPYSDECRKRILTYSIEEIFAEKLRSLFERTRPRDLYDAWYLSNILNVIDIIPVIKRKFEFKHIELSLERLAYRKEKFRSAWESSLRNQLRELPKFKIVYSKIESIIRTLIDNITHPSNSKS